MCSDTVTAGAQLAPIAMTLCWCVCQALTREDLAEQAVYARRALAISLVNALCAVIGRLPAATRPGGGRPLARPAVPGRGGAGAARPGGPRAREHVRPPGEPGGDRASTSAAPRQNVKMLTYFLNNFQTTIKIWETHDKFRNIFPTARHEKLIDAAAGLLHKFVRCKANQHAGE